jgi:hypothetical protein
MLTIAAMLNRMVKEWDFQGYSATVNVAAGTYNKNIALANINFLSLKSLVIAGAGRGSTIINADQSVRIDYLTTHLTIKSMTLMTSVQMVIVYYATYVTLEDIELHPSKPWIDASHYSMHFVSCAAVLQNLYWTEDAEQFLIIAQKLSDVSIGGTIDIGSQTKNLFKIVKNAIFIVMPNTVFSGTATGAQYVMAYQSLLDIRGKTIPGSTGTYDSSSVVMV